MNKLSITALLVMTIFVLADQNPSRSFLSTFDECDTECLDEYLRYGYTEGYAKYNCCFSYRLQLKKVALSSLSTANLDRESLICDNDCYSEYSKNGFSVEISSNKCCYSNEGEGVKLYMRRPYHFGGGSSWSSSHSSSSSHTSWSTSTGSHSRLGSFYLTGWQIAVITGFAFALCGAATYAKIKIAERNKLIRR